MSPPTAATLVRTVALSQTLNVGLGNAVASVRTLTDISLTVHAEELVVLSGSRGAGERALLAVIAGDRRGVSGSCDVVSGVRTRLLRISTSSARALTEEWARAAQISATVSASDREAI